MVKLATDNRYYLEPFLHLGFPPRSGVSPVRLWGFCILRPIPTQLREVLQELKLRCLLEHLNLRACLHGDVSLILRISAALPVNPLVKLIEIELSAFLAFEQVPELVTFTDEGFQQLKTIPTIRLI